MKFKSILAYLTSVTMGLATFGVASAEIVISEVDLVANKVELINTGSMSLDVANWYWCNRVNGSPRYGLVSAHSTIDSILSTGNSLTTFDPGDILVLDLTANFLPDINGELGLYNTNQYANAQAIEDYILWGANGQRDIVAQNAGIWVDNQSIDVSGMGAGETIQLASGAPGNAASEYFIFRSSLGAVSVPEPSSTLALVAGSVLCAVRRRRTAS